MPGFQNGVIAETGKLIRDANSPTGGGGASQTGRTGIWMECYDGTDSFGYYNYPGSPEGNLHANIGSLCLDTTNGEVYKKSTDNSTSGWVKLIDSSSSLSTDFLLGNVLMWDDFISGGHSTNSMFQFGWQATSADFGSLDAAHPGVLIAGGGATTQLINNGARTSSGHVIVGGGEITLTWITKQGALASSADYTQRVGFFDDLSTINNGIYFEYTDTVNSGAWQIICESAGTKTTNNTSDTVTTDWTSLKIVVNAAGTSAAFYVDDVECANSPITTNIPSTGLYIGYDFTRVTNNDSHYADLVVLEQNLTAARY